ncbi:MAG TPA: histidine phosphatase family protein [Acetobacteraceae bacterium]|nr:histidine phosphatase family protein [Acetobacteraceae bacterium]
MTDITRFWLLRHAIVEENARAVLYGRMDVPLCPESLLAQASTYRRLAARLPRGAEWLVTPLSRTRCTAEAIQQAGYGAAPLTVEPGLTEQDLGAWQGLAHDELPSRLSQPAHVFWPLAAAEAPPGGESMVHVIERVGATLELRAEAHPGRDVVAVSHGGAIRAAVAHALGIGAANALHLAIQNLSLTVIERHPAAWRVLCVNEVLDD